MKKMFDIISHQGNADQCHNEIALHTHRGGLNQKDRQ